MKNILFILLFLPLLSFAQTDILYDYKILRVTDGDTIVISADYLPKPLKPQLSLRIFGVDTPEKGFRAKCATESQRGTDATNYTKKVIAEAKSIKVVIKDWDKYGGRVLGDIIVDGKSLRNLLINNNYAREYYGDKKQSWC
jgi:micrococcal nuclease